ncbi:winged helix-turn-helix domain-containing protein [Roseivivax sp.]
MATTELRTYDDTLDVVLTKVLLAPTDTTTVLHETALAEELGVSRTPVRQVLQELAIAGLVETRPGVGTVISSLYDTDRGMAFKVYAEIATAAANCCVGAKVDDGAKIEMVGQSLVAQNTTEHSMDLYARYAISICRSMASILPDDVLAHALTVAHWRVIRWRVADYAADPDGCWRALQENLQKVVVAMMRNNASETMRVAAGITSQLAEGAQEDFPRAVPSEAQRMG